MRNCWRVPRILGAYTRPMRRFALLAPGLVLLLAAPCLAKDEPGVPDKALQKQIDKAIETGGEWLKRQQKSSGAIGAVHAQGALHYEIGTTALAGLALLAAGDEPTISPFGPVERKGKKRRGKKKKDKDGAALTAVDRALAYCMKKDEQRAGARTTYDTATLIMFAAAYFHPKDDGKKKRSGKTVESKGAKGPCNLPPDAKAWLRDLALWLAGKQKDTGGWGYPEHREDWSNTQYALLGLRAARDCGVPIAPGVFVKAMDRALELQAQDGPKVMRTLPPDRPGGKEYVVDYGDRARGWGYLETNRNPTGSMTTAGIAILSICNDALSQPVRFKPYKPSKAAEVARGVQDGFAWLDVNFALDRNPGNNAPNWHYYYLYGLERAAVYGARVLIGKRDWYVEGARYLVGAQNPDGRWSTGNLGTEEYEASDVLDTAWAILFLKKATRPLTPIAAPVTGG